MQAAVDTSCFQLGVHPADGVPEEAPILEAYAADARVYIESFPWAPPIRDILLAYGVGGILGLFLVRFVHGIPGGGQGDTETWVVVGDIPSIYFETERTPTPALALKMYCAICQDWADKVLAGEDLSESYPIPVEPSEELASMLKRRIEFIREELIPLAAQLCPASEV